MAEGAATPQLANNPRLRPSLDRIARYGQNLFLLRGSQTASTIDNIRKLVEQHRALSGERRLVVFVDYMQKVPQIPEPENESEKVTFIVNGLKDIALSEDVPMVAIVAADKEGLKASRLRNFHLRGSSAINYEADIILILNEKYHIVAKVNIEFNPYQAQRFRDWVVASSRRTVVVRTTSTWSSRSTSSSPASTRKAGRCKKSSSRNASTTTEAAGG